MSELITVRRKRLIHKSRYRGCREADMIFGKFADAHVQTMDAQALDRFEALLDESDQDLLAWLMDRAAVPDRHKHDIFDMIKQFNVGVSGG